MKNTIYLFIVFGLFQTGFAQESPSIIKVKNLVKQAIENEEVVGISVGTRIADGTMWHYEKGYSNLDTKEPFTYITISRTASISKSITATAIMQLVEKGEIDLDKTLATYLPQFNTETLKNITVRQVMQHTSGLSGYKNNKEASNKKQYHSFDEALQIITSRDVLFAPGTDFAYTSYGYNALGLLIEKVSEMSYSDYLDIHIFKPAGMSHTSIEVHGVLVEGKSKLYNQLKPGKIKEITNHNISDRLAGGGVQSTLEDILKFGQAIVNNALISAESLTEMTTDHGLKKEGNGYGMGWYLYGESDTRGNIIGHSGTQYGCTAFLFLAPEKGLVTAVLSNTSRYNGHGTLAIAAFSIGEELKK